MELKAGAGGKLLLFGEHVALYKYPALGLGLPLRMEILLDAGESGLVLDIPGEYRDAVNKAAERIAEALSLPLPNGRLSITSDIPLASGFGSSAALCVALARLCMAAGNPLISGPARRSDDDDKAWKASHEGEKIFHGTPSGIDTALAVFGGLLRFDPNDRFPPSIRALEPFNAIPLVYGGVPRRAGCAASIAAIAKGMAGGDKTTRTAMESLGEISRDACSLLQDAREPPLADLAVLATGAMEDLRRLMLSTPDLDYILEIGLRAGALGGKMSGGGGGGAYWLVCPDIACAIHVSSEINKSAIVLGIQPEMRAKPLTV